MLGFLLLSIGSRSLAVSAESSSWRSGWIGEKFEDKDEAIITAAKDLGFNALILGGSPERLREFMAKARPAGIDTYWCFTPSSPKSGDPKLFEQVMPEKDQEILKRLRASKDWKHQYGGEPAPGHEDIFRRPLPCFHRKEVVEETKDAIREMLAQCPDLKGIAFDGFGYQNYRNCVCEESLSQLAAFRKSHPEMSPEVAEDAFSLESLVGLINGLADFARGLRTDIKTTIHIWPLYLPEPLYGNRLDLDYCCQTVAWFFPPYWPPDKIAKYTQAVVTEENKYFPRARGIPFLGIYIGKKNLPDKPLEQFRSELQTIFQNEPSKSLSIHELADVVLNDPYFEALKTALRENP